MTDSLIKAAHVLNSGQASGKILKLDEPLSFWGGFDPIDGRILDRSHPQAGISIKEKILAMPGSRGSAGTPGGVAEALRRKTGPAALILLVADVNITIGAHVADFLYGFKTPVLTVSEWGFALLQTGTQVEINDDSIKFSQTERANQKNA